MNRPKPKAQIFRRDSGLAEMGLSVAAERQCGVGSALARFILSSILPSMRKRDLLAWRGTGIGAGVTATPHPTREQTFEPHAEHDASSLRHHAKGVNEEVLVAL